MKHKLKLFFASLAVVAFASLAGCNTVAGFGMDLQAGGERITQAAQPTPQPVIVPVVVADE